MNHRDKNQGDVNRADKSMHQLCKQHMYYHVVAQTSDGQQIEGIITDLDNKNVYMLVPQNMMPVDEELQGSQQGAQQQIGQQITQQGDQQSGQQSPQRQRQSFGGSHYRKFYRQIFPLAKLMSLSLYPYYNPPYSYPYSYPYPYYPY